MDCCNALLYGQCYTTKPGAQYRHCQPCAAAMRFSTAVRTMLHNKARSAVHVLSTMCCRNALQYSSKNSALDANNDDDDDNEAKRKIMITVIMMIRMHWLKSGVDPQYFFALELNKVYSILLCCIVYFCTVLPIFGLAPPPPPPPTCFFLLWFPFPHV